MPRDARLYHIIETDYNGQCRCSIVHLFSEENEIVWSRYAELHFHENPHDELLDQMVVGTEAMGRYYSGELLETVGE